MRVWIADSLSRFGARALAALVPTPALLYALAVGSVIALFLRRARQADCANDASVGSATSAFFCAVIGTRLFYLAASGGLTTLPVGRWFSLEGTQSWGAYLGASAGLYFYLRWRGVPTLPYFDVAASCTALPIVIGRLACFLNADDFGRITDVPWAVRYPPGTYPFAAQVAAGRLDPAAPASMPTHPIQIYLALNGVIVFLVVSSIWRRYRDCPGITLASFLVLDGSTRFSLEFCRDVAAGGAANGLSLAQWMCVLAVTSGGVLLIRAAAARVPRLALPQQRGM